MAENQFPRLALFTPIVALRIVIITRYAICTRKTAVMIESLANQFAAFT